MLQITLEQINKVLEETKYKPNKYYHKCGGGATITRIDFWSDNEIEQCRHAGDDNWVCPWCKTCDGKHEGWSKLTDWEEGKNRGMEELASKLKELFV